MSKLFVIVIAMLLFAVPAIAQGPAADWAGLYEFGEDGGKTAGGSAIFISHEINVIESDDGLIALIKSSGFQTSRDLVGTAKVEGSKLHIYFDSYGEDNLLANFQEGGLLLTLEQKGSGNKRQLLTHWGNFQPVIEKYQKSGKSYFVKAQNLKL